MFGLVGGSFGDHALELVREGILRGLSISFRDRFTHPRRTAEGTVVRSSCELFDVSLVRHPAYASAVVTAMRSRAEWAVELQLPSVDETQLEELRAIGIQV